MFGGGGGVGVVKVGMKVLKVVLKEVFEKWVVWFVSVVCDMLDVCVRLFIFWCCEEVLWLVNEVNMLGFVMGVMMLVSDIWDRLLWLFLNMVEMLFFMFFIFMYSNFYGIDILEIFWKKNKYVEKDGGIENFDRLNMVLEFFVLV